MGVLIISPCAHAENDATGAQDRKSDRAQANDPLRG
eukprot:gene14841-21872_t